METGNHDLSASAVGAPHRRERLFIIAYPNGSGHIYGQSQKQSAEIRQYAQREPIPSGENVSDTQCTGLERHGQFTEYVLNSPRHITSGNISYANVSDPNIRRLEGSKEERRNGTDVVRNCGNGSQSENVSDTSPKRFQRGISKEGYVAERGWWASEPQLGRVAHGISNRVDRIKCLGNAVVPQCAEVFAKAIKVYEEGIEK